MTNLTVLALTLAALVAFATAHTTIVTTTTTIIDDTNQISDQSQCSQRLQGQELDQCRMFLMKGQIIDEGSYPSMSRPEEVIQQDCCQELHKVDEQCQCEAVKQVHREVKKRLQQQQGPHFGPFGFREIQKSKLKAQALPNLCNLRLKQCRIGTISQGRKQLFSQKNEQAI